MPTSLFHNPCLWFKLFNLIMHGDGLNFSISNHHIVIMEPINLRFILHVNKILQCCHRHQIDRIDQSPIKYNLISLPLSQRCYLHKQFWDTWWNSHKQPIDIYIIHSPKDMYYNVNLPFPLWHNVSHQRNENFKIRLVRRQHRLPCRFL